MKKLFVLAILACFSLNAHAVQFDTPVGKLDIYASVRAFSAYNDLSVDDDTAGRRDFSDLKTRLQTNSRFGAKFDSGKIYGQVEFDGASDIGLRLLYAGYKLDGDNGKVQFGQFTSISDTKGYANRVLDSDAALVGFGALNDARRAGIGYYVKGFSVQLTTLSQDDRHRGLIQGYTDVRLKEFVPKIELAYQIKDFKVMGAFAHYTANGWDAANSKDKDFDANAYHVAFGYTPKFDNLTVKVSGMYAVNAGLYSMVRTGNSSGEPSTNLIPAIDSDNDIEDIKTYGGTLAFNYKVNSNVSTEFGIGYQVSDSDIWDKKDANMAVYVNAPITVYKGFRVTPEIGYLDYLKDRNDIKEPKVLQAGVQLRIDL